MTSPDLDMPVRFGSLSIDAFVDQLASGAPTPGGGSASAVVGALGAGLVSMVAALSDGHSASAVHGSTIAATGAAGRELATRCLTFADDDAAAFGGFGVAMKLPRTTDEEKATRSAAIRAAARSAADVPLACLATCVGVAEAAEALAGRSNPNLASDLVVASRFAEAAAHGAAANVRVNLPLVRDPAWEAAMSTQVAAHLERVEALGASTRSVIGRGLARDPLMPVPGSPAAERHEVVS